jgi:hypothetical protein
VSSEHIFSNAITEGENTTSDALAILDRSLLNQIEQFEKSADRITTAVCNAYRFHDAILAFAWQSAGQLVFDRTRNRDYAIAAAEAAAAASSQQFTV